MWPASLADFAQTSRGRCTPLCFIAFKLSQLPVSEEADPRSGRIKDVPRLGRRHLLMTGSNRLEL